MQHMTPRAPSTRMRAGAAVAIGALVALAGCSSNEGAAEPSGSSEETTAAVAGPTTLQISTNRAPSPFDPVQMQRGTDALIWGSIYDTMFIIGPDGELVPHLAESYEYSDDGLQLTLHLREGLTFSNGGPATAEDYAATLLYVRDNPGSNQTLTDRIESVEAVDETTVEITFSQPDPGFLFDLTSSIGIIADPELMTEESYGLEPIGAGPYVLDTDASLAGTEYVLTKRDDYWNADAYPFEEITVSVIADATAIENALRAGELDIANVSSQVAPQFEADANFTLQSLQASSSIFIDIADRDGTVAPALADVRVRQAINMAFDREGMVTNLLGGTGIPAHQMFFPSTSGYDPELEGYYPYDLEGAKALMEEAGYGDGFTIDMPSLVYTTTFEPAVTQALADIGITVNWTSVPPQDTVSALLSGEYPVVMWFASTLPSPNEVDDYYGTTALLNPFRTTDPELDPLLAEADAVADASTAGDLYQEINRTATELAWYAPLFFTGQQFASRTGYEYIGTESQQSVRIESYGVSAG
ncbi:ABC transporter substrate-binding protein [Demequina sp. NBRC 110057]|uniref:ABC transporter substrate-binding protein n=1 Tax=Demequina sp. NBRC 110057 TaxID=1570346 RepID=UPI000A01883A|nr:ABC transporter substrate-binding protein [Demequina sp. NBRC 110057]